MPSRMVPLPFHLSHCSALLVNNLKMSMQLVLTDQIRNVLNQAAGDPASDQRYHTAAAAEIKDVAQHAIQSGHVAWSSLKKIVEHINSKRHESQPALMLHQLCSGSEIVLPAPAPKPINPELEARRKKLQAELENRQYAEMVSDITQKEREAEAMRDTLPTSQAQLSFGAHVIVTMFTFWALAYFGSKQWLGWDELWAGLLGALGLTVGMLLETTLLIIRSNMPQSLEERYPHLVDPKIWNKKKRQQVSATDDDPLRPRTVTASNSRNGGSTESKKSK